MYLKGPAVLGKTQDLSIYGQLSYGIRYFDLRPKWENKDNTFYIHHGVIQGPPLSHVLDDVKRFFKKGFRELVILKFSHYDSFNNKVYKNMVTLIEKKIGKWLYSQTPLPPTRLADIKLGEFLETSGVILLVCDENYPVNNKSPGIWVYRDWDSDDPQQGDLRVFDSYSNTMSYDSMKNDQSVKFRRYKGLCKKKANVPCDLFLLSWTLTPPTDVWDVSKAANRMLGADILDFKVPNLYGYITNLLYVDYVEYARVTDVALFMNNAPFGDRKKK
jgi:hypothetical protein